MSNTGYKCIHARKSKDGETICFQVCVQWQGKRLFRRASTIEEALAVRDEFERELGKPRSERHIRSHHDGLTLSKDGMGKLSWRAAVGKRRKHYSISRYGFDKARELAEKARDEMRKKADEERMASA